MPRPARLDSRGLRSRAYWPTLTEEIQLAFLSYLSWWRAVAETAAEKCAELSAISPEPEIMRNNLVYWQTVQKSIDWLIHHLPHRQEYLEWELAQKEGRLTVPVTLPDTSSLPAAQQSSSEPTARAGADSPAGGTRPTRSGKRSPRRGPTA